MSVLFACLIGISIVYSIGGSYASYSSQSDSIYTYFTSFLWQYDTYNTTTTTRDSGVLFTTNIDIYDAGGEKIP